MADTQSAALPPECCSMCHDATGTLRYCAPRRCYCGHKTCPAYATYVNVRATPDNVVALAPGTRFDRRRANARATA